MFLALAKWFVDTVAYTVSLRITLLIVAASDYATEQHEMAHNAHWAERNKLLINVNKSHKTILS